MLALNLMQEILKKYTCTKISDFKNALPTLLKWNNAFSYFPVFSLVDAPLNSTSQQSMAISQNLIVVRNNPSVIRTSIYLFTVFQYVLQVPY